MTEERISKTYGVGTRLRKPPSKEMIEYFGRTCEEILDALSFDCITRNIKAHVVMLHEQGLLPKEHASKVLETLREIDDLGVDDFPFDWGLLDINPNIEIYITSKLGREIGGSWYKGYSRGAFWPVFTRMIERECTLRLLEGLLAFRKALIEVASQHVDTVMPGYTHMKHAQPTTYAHHLLSYLGALSRDSDRLMDAYKRINLSPMGSVSFTTTSYPLDRYRTMELLGFDDLVENARDAWGASDHLLELVSDIAILATHLNKLVMDLFMWSSDEYGMIEVADEDATTSSMLPQKKNPMILEMIRAETGRNLGETASVFNINLMISSSEANALYYSDHPGLIAIKRMTNILGCLSNVIPRVIVHEDVMRERAGIFWGTAPDLADTMVKEKDLPFRIAHEIVGKLVAMAIDRGISPRKVVSKLVDEAAIAVMGKPIQLNEEIIRKSLDPVESVKSKTLVGGTSPEVVSKAIKTTREKIAQDEKLLSEKRDRLRESERMLGEVVDRIISGGT
jgi:argininosuccinate lyase